MPRVWGKLFILSPRIYFCVVAGLEDGGDKKTATHIPGWLGVSNWSAGGRECEHQLVGLVCQCHQKHLFPIIVIEAELVAAVHFKQQSEESAEVELPVQAQVAQHEVYTFRCRLEGEGRSMCSLLVASDVGPIHFPRLTGSLEFELEHGLKVVQYFAYAGSFRAGSIGIGV